MSEVCSGEQTFVQLRTGLRREVIYLGHTISADGVSCESGKVECVQNWPTPTTTTELRSFLGFASYYRRFIGGFARIAGPLHDLVSEGAKHSKKKAADVFRLWGPKHQEAFDSLKGAMTTAPVLGYADNTKPFIFETSASQDGLSAILFQEQDGKSRVFAFASRCLRPSEKNSSPYSSMKLEFLAMKWAITDKFRLYLLGGKFTVITAPQTADLLSLREIRRVGAKMGLSSHSSILTSSTDLERSTLLIPFPVPL